MENTFTSGILLMKNSFPAILSVFAGITFATVDSVRAQDAEYPGVEKAMPAQEYEAAGLQKLSATERARLDNYIRSLVSSSSQHAASAALDRAVKESKAHPPEVIQSRIVGPFSGYTGSTTFTLENGQRWSQAQRDHAYFPKSDSPPVLIVKGRIGYTMYIAGGGVIRVTRSH